MVPIHWRQLEKNESLYYSFNQNYQYSHHAFKEKDQKKKEYLFVLSSKTAIKKEEIAIIIQVRVLLSFLTFYSGTIFIWLEEN